MNTTQTRAGVAALILLTTAIAQFASGQPASSQPAEAAASSDTPDYSGDFMTRSTMTGDWGGLRNELAKKGLTFDLSVTQIYQGVTGGGTQPGRFLPRPGSGDRTWQYNGTGDFLFNLDTQKLGLWPGGFFTLEAEGNWGNNANTNLQSGGIVPVNSNTIYLSPIDDSIGISNVSYAQFVSEHLGFFVGKIATISQTTGDMNDFAHGKGDSNFINLAFNLNPTALMVPYSTLGAGIIILPGKTPDDAVISLAVFQPDGEPNTAGFNTLGQDGTMFTGEARIKTNFFGHTGHQLIGGAYSDKLYTSLDQTFRVDVESRQIAQTSGAWCVYYNFDQYLVETGKDQGWGVFGRFGISDGDPSPIKSFWSLGLGGKGVIDSRPNDRFGVGVYQAITSNASVPSFAGIGDDWGAEAFYNIAITPWMQLTPDVQYIDGGRATADPAWIMGLRLKLVF
jgi:porin